MTSLSPIRLREDPAFLGYIAAVGMAYLAAAGLL